MPNFIGSFAVSALGSHGAAIIDPISVWSSFLNYGPIAPDGGVDIYLSVDHRVIDGGPAARAIRALNSAGGYLPLGVSRPSRSDCLEKRDGLRPDASEAVERRVSHQRDGADVQPDAAQRNTIQTLTTLRGEDSRVRLFAQFATARVVKQIGLSSFLGRYAGSRIGRLAVLSANELHPHAAILR